MALPKVSQKTALFIVVPVILAMLAWGVVTWPSEEDQKKYQERKQFKADSLKSIENDVSFMLMDGSKSLMDYPGYLDEE